jgi:hypothetical protein
MDPDAYLDPPISVSDLKDVNKELFFQLRVLHFWSVTFKMPKKFFSFYYYYFLKAQLNHFSNIKSHREITKQ